MDDGKQSFVTVADVAPGAAVTIAACGGAKKSMGEDDDEDEE